MTEEHPPRKTYCSAGVPIYPDASGNSSKTTLIGGLGR